MKTRDYITIKELKEILANIPNNYYACVQGGEDVGGEWGELYISPTVPDYWMAAERIVILKY